MKGDRLSAKQRRFIEEYLVDLNATQAAIRAGYSEKTAFVIGSENLTKPNIADAIQKAMDARSKRTEITADRVLQEIATLAFANIYDYVNWDNGAVSIRAAQDIEKGKLAAVSEISEVQTENGTNVKLKMHDKKGALEMAGRHLKLFTDKIEQTVKLEAVSDSELDARIAKLLAKT